MFAVCVILAGDGLPYTTQETMYATSKYIYGLNLSNVIGELQGFIYDSGYCQLNLFI